MEASITNRQLISAVSAWVMNPLKDEKHTINIEVAAAIFVGTLSIYMRRGTINTPPPIPRRPAKKPINNPIAPPPIILLFWLISFSSSLMLLDRIILMAATKITNDIIPINIRIFIQSVARAPKGAERVEVIKRGTAIEKFIIFFLTYTLVADIAAMPFKKRDVETALWTGRFIKINRGENMSPPPSPIIVNINEDKKITGRMICKATENPL